MKDPDVERLQRQVNDLKNALGALITWMAQSANSPIRPDEATKLLRMADGDKA